MSFSGYLSNEDGGADVNFNKNPARFPDPWAKIAGVGCAGTNSGIDASKSVFVEPPYVGIGGSIRRKNRSLKRHYRNKKYTGGTSGYGFSDPNNNPIQIASPYSLYPVINTYENSANFKAPQFPQQFMGGKPFSAQFTGDKYKGGRKTMRKHKKNKKMIQYGCSKKGRTCNGGGYYSMRLSRRGGARRSMRKTNRRSMRRSNKRSKTMRGGMSDYTQGRDFSQDQPYANQAISFGQGFDTTLDADNSSLASPIPLLPYNTCGKYRN